MNLRDKKIEDARGWLDIDREYLNTMEMKKMVLSRESEYEAIAEVAGKEASSDGRLKRLIRIASEEVFDCIFEELQTRFPGLVSQSISANGTRIVRNHATGRRWTVASNFLRIAAELVMEDLVLMVPFRWKESPEEGYFLAAGVVCFPDRWRLRDKLSKSLIEIHQSVEHYSDSLAVAVNGFFKRLNPEHGVTIRYNYTFQRGGGLMGFGENSDEDSDDGEPSDSRYYGNPGPRKDALFMRVERQGLRKMQCGAVLFTIRTYLQAVSEIEPSVHGDLRDALFHKTKTSLGKQNIGEAERAEILRQLS